MMEPTIKCLLSSHFVFTQLSSHVASPEQLLNCATVTFSEKMNMSAVHNLRLLTTASQFKGNNSCEVLISRYSLHSSIIKVPSEILCFPFVFEFPLGPAQNVCLQLIS